MKNQIFIFISKIIASNRLLWAMFKPFVQIAGLIKYQKDVFDSHTASPEVLQVIGDTTVKHGPFKGMKYPSFFTNGSTLGPKIIGSYESELHEIIEAICNSNYSTILDIGCAEGYYAVGFAIRSKSVNVYAYDTDEEAKKFCSDMAKLNFVSSRIILDSFCTSETLMKFNFSGKSLIMSDCEGYEVELFNKENIANLKNVDILVEIHDFNRIDTSNYIYDLFSPTHDIKVIESIDDIKKAKLYKYPETSCLPLDLRKKVFAENRINIMEWYFMTPKSN